MANESPDEPRRRGKTMTDHIAAIEALIERATAHFAGSGGFPEGEQATAADVGGEPLWVEMGRDGRGGHLRLIRFGSIQDRDKLLSTNSLGERARLAMAALDSWNIKFSADGRTNDRDARYYAGTHGPVWATIFRDLFK
jgi:hypothetical protein